MSKIGKQIKAARDAKGWTQRELAKRADVSQGLITKIETGRQVQRSSLEKVIAALGGDFEQVLVREPEVRNPALEAAEALPPELHEMAARWMRILPHLPERTRDVHLDEIAVWEKKHAENLQLSLSKIIKN